jgi:hypothetical protein
MESLNTEICKFLTI